MFFLKQFLILLEKDQIQKKSKHNILITVTRLFFYFESYSNNL